MGTTFSTYRYSLYLHNNTHHSHGLRVKHLLRGEGGEISQVGQNIHCSHYGQRYDDGSWKVSEEDSQTFLITAQDSKTHHQPLLSRSQFIMKAHAAYEYSLERLDHFLCDKIQVVPVNRGSDMVQVCLSLCLKCHHPRLIFNQRRLSDKLHLAKLQSYQPIEQFTGKRQESEQPYGTKSHTLVTVYECGLGDACLCVKTA